MFNLPVTQSLKSCLKTTLVFPDFIKVVATISLLLYLVTYTFEDITTPVFLIVRQGSDLDPVNSL